MGASGLPVLQFDHMQKSDIKISTRLSSPHTYAGQSQTIRHISIQSSSLVKACNCTCALAGMLSGAESVVPTIGGLPVWPLAPHEFTVIACQVSATYAYSASLIDCQQGI